MRRDESKPQMEDLQAVAAPSVVQDIENVIAKHSRGVIETVKTPDGVDVPVLFGINGQASVMNPASFDAWRPHPVRRKGNAQLDTLESLIDHANRFKDEGSALYAEAETGKPKITAILDYHPEGSASSPRFGEHRSVYQFPVSEEWTAWTQSDGKVMPMGEFASFIEDRLVDVVQVLDLEELPEDVRAFAKTFETGIASPGKLLEMRRSGARRVIVERARQMRDQLGLPSLPVLDAGKEAA